MASTDTKPAGRTGASGDPAPRSTRTPDRQAPSTEAPSTEAPSTGAPSTEAPSTGAPTGQSRSTEIAGSADPASEVPGTAAPSSEAPNSVVPGAEASSTDPTDAHATRTGTSTNVPDTEAAGTSASGTAALRPRNPGLHSPGNAALSTDLTDPKSPGAAMPDTGTTGTPAPVPNALPAPNAPQAAPGTDGTAPGTDVEDLEAGLDALETAPVQRQPLHRVLTGKVLPPIVAVALVLAVWQLLYAAHVKRPDLLPGPLDVWRSLHEQWLEGTILGTIWTSVSRGALGFLASMALGTPLGLLVARIKPVRAAIGPVLTGLQSIPSVAWVPAAILWFGLSNATIYAVILLGAVPSIANGLVAGVDQVQPIYLRAGRTLGATGARGIRFVLLPAALPGYLAGLKQGWAFAWRSLMAAELIASSPSLGLGLGQTLENARETQDMPTVLATVILILLVGIGIELIVFAPMERRVLRSRGLLAAGR